MLQISILWKYYFPSVSADKRICADREGVAGRWLKLHNGKIDNVKFSSNIILTKLRRMILTVLSEIWCENH